MNNELKVKLRYRSVKNGNVKVIIFDLIDEVDENQILAGLSKLLGELKYDFEYVNSEVSKVINLLGNNFDISSKSEVISKICMCFIELKRMGFEFYVKPIPMPDNLDLLMILKNSDVKVRPDREITITPLALAILVNFCKTIDVPFKIIDVIKEKGLLIIVGEIYEQDEIVIIETNIDDVSGEIIGNALDKILKHALDVTAIQCIGKKGRPCVILQVLAKLEDVEKVAKIVMEETGSLGVRILPVRRIIARRIIKEHNIEIFGRKYTIRVKYSSPSIFKPEFEDVKRIAEDLNIPIIVAYKEVLRALSSS